jgi:PAS domain S-box-containing protein/putative nucleotidyltransferase with HDIG domain
MRPSVKAAKTPEKEQKNFRPTAGVSKGDLRVAWNHAPRAFLYTAGIVAGLIVAASVVVVLWVPDVHLRIFISEMLSSLLALTACIFLFIAAKNTFARSKKLAIAWGIIALGPLFYSAGGFAWFSLEIGLKEPPFPSIADAAYLVHYPLFLVGAFLLVEKPATIGEWVTRALDFGIIIGSAFIGMGVLMIGPAINSSASQPVLAQAILVAYPIGDLVLLGALFLILFNPSKRQSTTPMFLLVACLVAVIVTDLEYSFQSVFGNYVSGGVLDMGWIVGSLLSILAGIAQSVDVQTEKDSEIILHESKFQDRLIWFQSYVPYFWLTAICLLFFGGEMGIISLPMAVSDLSLGVGAIIFLVVVREIITLTENGKLNIRLRNSMDRIQIQAAELEIANRELQNDINERKLVEVSLTKSEEFNRNLVEASPIGILYLDKDFRITFENQTMRQITGVPDGSPPPAMGEKLIELASIKAVLEDRTLRALLAGEAIHGEVVHYRSIMGREADLDIHTSPLRKAGGQLEGTVLLVQDISERMRAEAARRQSDALFRALFELSPDAIVLIDPHGPSGSWPIVDCNVAACRMNGYTREEMIGQSIDLLNFAAGTPDERNAYMQKLRVEGVHALEVRHRRKDGTQFFADSSASLIAIAGRELVVGIDHDISERKRAEEEITRRLSELEAINKVSSALRTAHTLDEMLPILLDKTLEVIHAAQGSIWLFDPEKNTLGAAVARGYDAQTGPSSLSPVSAGKGIVGRVFAGGQPYVTGDFRSFPGLSKETRQLISPGIGGAVIPIRAEEDVIGVFMINIPSPRELTPEEVHLLTTLSEIAGNAIRRTSLSQQTDRRLRQLTALSQIDRAITSSLDLHLNLNTLLQEAIAQLEIHAADVLLFNPASQTLDFIAGSGFRTRNFEQTHQRLGEGYAGRAALERQIIHVPNLAERNDNPLAAKAVADEAFVSYFAVPLLAKGQIKGVLEIFHRAPLDRGAEWLDFLNTLAGQAAIAIDNSTLFENLQRANLELTLAYDDTIEGWSRALDLRDKETEGHTQRVTEMTVRLARTMDLGETELVKIRWGALLHDIGKMGIPDGILFKPGPLSDEEWVIMKRHPQFAFEMLSPIQYLRSAIDIPYHHHEKWDGTGYPLGLKGEQIPLAARVFAVVDVWDALRSDRPYRTAWPVEKVREHIRSLAGTHFDPRVVKAFLALDAVAGKRRDGTAS